MSNAMKYIKDLEAAGFDRHQAEAQVQMVLDAIEGDLATKSDLSILRTNLSNDSAVLRSDLSNLKSEFQNDLDRIETRFERKLIETEFRIVTRLGFLIVSTATVGIAVLTWLIKIH